MELPSFIPVLTTESGSALIASDWVTVGVHTVSCDLAALLMKPGIEVLKQLTSLASYFGWQGKIVLNASRLVCNAQNMYEVRSIYDGSIHRYTSDAMIKLVTHLKPDVFIPPAMMPYDVWLPLSSRMQCIVALEEGAALPDRPGVIGVFVAYDAKNMHEDALLDLCKTYRPHTCYVAGYVNVALQRDLVKLGVQWIESDQPAKDALKGIVYVAEETLDITDSSMVMAHQPLVGNCTCEACSLGLTRAYFHHLYAQTPGLCQRFLIQHNVETCLKTSFCTTP